MRKENTIFYVLNSSMYQSYIDKMDYSKYKAKFEFLKRLLPENPVIVECGAHYGEDTIRFLHTFSGCHIHAFECDPRNLAIIRKHLSLEQRCSINPIALGKQNGTMPFYQAFKSEPLQKKYEWIGSEDFESLRLGNSGSSSLKKSSRPDLTNSKTIEVPVTTLDSYAYERVDLLWIDVQGAEKDLLEGASNTLSKTKHIWIEAGETTYQDAMTIKETKQLLNEHGFQFIKKDKNDLLFSKLET